MKSSNNASHIKNQQEQERVLAEAQALAAHGVPKHLDGDI
jgi:hypothetical protein